MPIYAYRCDSCGARKDVLQKVSDAALTTCPACGAESFRKALTAPAFQLKGSGWYVTDFRDNGKPRDKSAGGDNGGEASSPAASDSPAPAAEPTEAAAPAPAPAKSDAAGAAPAA